MADNIRIIQNLFSSLESSLFLGDRLDRGEFTVMMQPGQFVSTNLKEDNLEDMAIQASLVDDRLDTSYVYKPLLGTISRSYHDILDQRALPFRPLSAAAQKEANQIKQWLDDNRKEHSQRQDILFDLKDALETEQKSQHPSSSRIQRLMLKVNDAQAEFDPIDQLWRNKLGRQMDLLSANPESVFLDLKVRMQAMERASVPLGTYYNTFLSPPVALWPDAGTSWSTFERTIKESDSSSYSRSTAWKGGVGFGWGLFSFGGSVSGSKTYQHQESNASEIKLKFEYLRARILRPWLVEEVFGYRFWTWKKEFGFHLLSDGGNMGVTPPVRPVGEMPLLSRSIIIVRNLEISANFSHEDSTFIESNLNTSASAGWGPFSISGSYSESTQQRIAHASFDGTKLSIAQPQIIAFTGKLLTQPSPNPDPTLNWQGDQYPINSLPHDAMIAQRAARHTDALNRAEEAIMLEEGEDRRRAFAASLPSSTRISVRAAELVRALEAPDEKDASEVKASDAIMVSPTRASRNA